MRRTFLLVLWGCSGPTTPTETDEDPTSEGDADADSDADADADADADSDTDSDADTDPPSTGDTGSTTPPPGCNTLLEYCTLTTETWTALSPGGALSNSFNTETTYGPCGVQVGLHLDYDSDFVWDEERVGTLDKLDRLVEEVTDVELDGTIDERHTYTYDAYGDLVLVSWDTFDDGTIDGQISYSWVGGLLVQSIYNAAGLLISTTYTHDGYDNVIETESDTDDDGTVEVLAYTDWYDDLGVRRIDGTRTDLASNGSIDTISDWTWTVGLLDTIDIDLTNDGTDDQRTAYTYDANGRATLVQSMSLPSLDVLVELRQTWVCPP